jgi:hypothetical protein
MTDENIRRLINNQKDEHSPHAFRAGGAAMADFDELYPALRSLPRTTLARWMRLIDKMRATHDGCLPCSSKILAYSILFTQDLLPELCEKYTRLYYQQIRHNTPPPGRDYMAEVINSLKQGPESPAAQLHRRNWRELAEQFALDKRSDRD